ncbi:hypothetical protein Dshi_4122 (plasmid) [Dinoroseobacter shibae DFL 12 = DSM 16493]|jgi:hypothetical protein|uniref:Sulfotransferase family protein n=1 Tax=Dinoroseobacter shibae (strain DSM 16493 / NCIMB 14021 / DFL 12) TaxID=398580 RepID=A8LUC2_DINSH|nr:sulfotransferase family 2 domain-containing protein [Dinoroseobacter shibae]ABV95839.1 hypothetical protein Dshi_4122 [Dinoroseobacter shibae DFL 12 = DSM 16493]URF49086.1 sulfotransferase family protein [Dinoroseobacter shibae]URF53395.1 sulfotransferase family protein [Dinoroseobacter shibae]
MSVSATAPLVFLHIPKTAGQTIHEELARALGPETVSPVRRYNQVAAGAPQMPPGYSLYSGPLDWGETDTLPSGAFVFTVLRDPFERLASYYLYVLKMARARADEVLEQPQEPHLRGLRRILTMSAEEYFFGGDAAWQGFIRAHYDNFYTSYFATRRMLGWREVQALDEETALQAALSNVPRMSRIYSIRELGALEADMAARGLEISVTETFRRATDDAHQERRWPMLAARFESDAGIRRLEAFAVRDELLLSELGLRV